MNTTNIPVQPHVITEVKTISNLRLHIEHLELFKSVLVRVELLNAQDEIIEIKYVMIYGDDYTNWNNDDQYLINKVAEKLELILS